MFQEISAEALQRRAKAREKVWRKRELRKTLEIFQLSHRGSSASPRQHPASTTRHDSDRGPRTHDRTVQYLRTVHDGGRSSPFASLGNSSSFSDEPAETRRKRHDPGRSHGRESHTRQVDDPSVSRQVSQSRRVRRESVSPLASSRRHFQVTDPRLGRGLGYSRALRSSYRPLTPAPARAIASAVPTNVRFALGLSID